MAIRVLLVDDQPEVRAVLRTALRLRPRLEVVGEAKDGRTAFAVAASLRPDVIVLDLNLPDCTGRDALAGVRDAAPDSDVLVFAAAESDRDWYQGRVAGYIRKDEDLTRLIDALESTPLESTPLED